MKVLTSTLLILIAGGLLCQEAIAKSVKSKRDAEIMTVPITANDGYVLAKRGYRVGPHLKFCINSIPNMKKTGCRGTRLDSTKGAFPSYSPQEYLDLKWGKGTVKFVSMSPHPRGTVLYYKIIQ